ncbi:MAG: hypothetical protein ACM33V_14755 [Chloroflexota bacterium]
MSFPYTPRSQDVKLESLQTQLEHLNLLRLRHLHWMNSADDSQTKAMHSRIVEQIREISDQYKGLLTALRQ